MKHISFLTFYLLIPFFAFTQSATMPVILISSSGKITHKDEVLTNLVTGSIMNKKGTLSISKGGKVQIYHNFTFLQKSAADSPLDLANVFNSDDELISQTESDLGDYIANAVYSATTSGIVMKNQTKLVSGWGSKGTGNRDGWGSKGTGSRDGWGSKGTGSKDGWGSKGSGGKDGWLNSEIVSRTLIPGGAYIEGNNLLSWKAIPGTMKYTFVIEDIDNNIVYKQDVTGTSLNLNTSTAKLERGKSYAWYIHHPVNRQVSTPVPFTVVSAEMESQALAGLKDLSLYKESDQITKELMEASQLHLANLFLLSQKKYNDILKKAPGNSLAKMMYAYFCNELGEIENAAEILEK